MTDPDWGQLYAEHPEPLVAELKKGFERGEIALTAGDLANAASTVSHKLTERQAQALLESAGNWLIEEPIFGEPDLDFPNEPPPRMGVRYFWRGDARRTSEWLLLIHGMNTRGLWQQYLSFDLGLWQGLGIPTFVYKYGVIRLGVCLPWRRRKFKRELSAEILQLSEKAPAFRVGRAPDVVAHSFGTWLVGHVLLDELKETREQEAGKPGKPLGLKLGRLILTGSVLRPDFDWTSLQAAGLVEDVLNVYGTKDVIVPLAHWTIFDSGPSGRRGFDIPSNSGASQKVVNVKADFTHSQALSDAERYEGHKKTWKPFLSNPVGLAPRGLTVTDPRQTWKPAWWFLRGTMLPLIIAPLLLAVLAKGVLALGSPLSSLDQQIGDSVWGLARYLGFAGVGLGALFLVYLAWRVARKARSEL